MWKKGMHVRWCRRIHPELVVVRYSLPIYTVYTSKIKYLKTICQLWCSNIWYQMFDFWICTNQWSNIASLTPRQLSTISLRVPRIGSLPNRQWANPWSQHRVPDIEFPQIKVSDFFLDDIWREEAASECWQIEITKESMDEHHLSCIALFCFVLLLLLLLLFLLLLLLLLLLWLVPIHWFLECKSMVKMTMEISRQMLDGRSGGGSLNHTLFMST